MKMVHKLVNLLGCLTFVSIMFMVLYQIFMRFVLKIGVPWVEEVSRLFYVYLSFLGAAICLRDKQLIIIDTIPNILPPLPKKLLAAVSEIFCFAVIAMLLRGAIKMAGITWGSPLATVDFISNGWIYIAAVASFSYMLLVKAASLIGYGVSKR